MVGPKASANKPPENADRTLSLGLYVASGLIVLACGVWYRESLMSALYSLEAVFARHHIWGPILLSLIASLWAILCLPGPIILGFVGTVYSHEPWLGLLIVVVADSVAEVFGFLVARHLGRERVSKWLEKKPWFQWLEEQTEIRGAYGVFVIRMMPFFPNSLANYAMGLSALRFGPYIVASILGSIPNLAVYVMGTAGAVHLLRTGFGMDALYVASAILLVTTIVLIGLQSVLRRHGRLAEWNPERVTEQSDQAD
jgi:uncharacterized membrane protein YdjX (TVP38/TMEM64 family)